MTPLAVITSIEAAICVVCFLIARRDPRRFAVLLLAVTAPLEVYRTEFGGLNISLFRLSLGLAIVIALLVPASRLALRRLAEMPVLLAYAGLAGTMMLSLVITSDNTELGARVVAQVLIGLSATAVVYSLATAESLSQVTRYLLMGAALPLLAAAWQQMAHVIGAGEALPFLSSLPVPAGLEVTRDPLPVFEETTRVRGTFGDPSHFGTYLLMVGAVSLAGAVNAFRQRARQAAAAHGLLLICVVGAVFGTYSRSAWLGLVIAIAVVALSFWHRLALDPTRTRRAAVLPVAIAAAFMVFTVPFASAIDGRLDPSAPGNVISNSAHERTVTVALDDLVGAPLTGIGLADLGPQLEQAERSSGAHSSYLTVAAELGAPGLILLLVGLALTLRLLFARIRVSADPERLLFQGLAAGYIGFAAANLSYDLWWDDFHWLMLGLILASTWRRMDPRAPVIQAGRGF